MAPWSAFVYTINAADLVPHEGNFCRVYAYLLIGTSNYDASFVESPLFVALP